MTGTCYQVEFYSVQEQRWVPLFTHEKSEVEAARKARDWLAHARSRVVRVTQKTEVVWENTAVGQWTQGEEREIDSPTA